MRKAIFNLSKKCKNKKVVFYCIGKLFEQAAKDFELNELFKIQALCDIRFKENEKYKNLPCIHPNSLKNLDFDYIIIMSENFDAKEKYLKENNLLPKKSKILALKPKEAKIDVRKNYKNVLKTLKTKQKLRILFICEQNQKWCYTNLYKALEKLDNFEVLPVLLLPVIQSGENIFTQEENKKFFDKLNINSLDGFDYKTNENIDIKLLNPDIVFYQQPWYLNNKNHPKYVSFYALTIMAPYGYTTLNEKAWGTNNTKEVYRSLWLFLAESPYHIKFYKKAAKMKNNLVALGSLKLDEYKKPARNTAATKKTIIYAPHHSLGNDGLKMATFDKNYKLFLDFAKNNPQYNFIFKPHPMLKNAVVVHNLMNEEEYENYIKEWENLPNSEVYQDGEYFEIFKTSDVLITDCSSFLAEYFPSKKPIVFINRKDRAPFDKFGEKIKKGFCVVDDFSQIEPVLRDILDKNNDPLYKTREKILKKEFYIKEKSAYEGVIDILMRI